MNKKDVIRFGFADYSLRSSASSLSTLRKFSALPAAQRRAELNVVFSRILHPDAAGDTHGNRYHARSNSLHGVKVIEN